MEHCVALSMSLVNKKSIGLTIEQKLYCGIQFSKMINQNAHIFHASVLKVLQMN